MDTFERLEEHLHGALAHLHHCDYRPPPMLYAVTGCRPEDGAASVQSAIIREIARLEPDPEIPRDALARRVYDVLWHRYVQKLTLERTAELLDLSVRNLTRIQRDAVHTLARVLWERRTERRRSAGNGTQQTTTRPPGEEPPDSLAAEWFSQMRRELASLQMSAPGAVSNVEEVIRDVIEIENALVVGNGILVEAGSVQPGLTAATHPSALRQMLITALGQMVRRAQVSSITIYARLQDGNVRITLAGSLAGGDRPTEEDITPQILVPEDCSIEVCIDGDQIFLWLELPSEGRTTVLVIDDNVDMARFYQRATEGTNYCIVHIARGQEALEAVESIAPDIIVLDVMLPDADGWRLLMHFHQNETTRATPVIICSVVREERLALSLGAALYLPKPIRHRQFIQALDEALPTV